MPKYFSVMPMIILLVACEGPFNNIGDSLKDNLMTVSYENGLSITEAKIVADAYLYIHGGDLGPAPYVNITGGEDAWVGVVYKGFAVSPIKANVPPVLVDKITGYISWGQGPTVHRIDSAQIVNKKITAGRAISGEAFSAPDV